MPSDYVKRILAQKDLSVDKRSKLAVVTPATLVRIGSGANDDPKIRTPKAIADELGVGVDGLMQTESSPPGATT